MSETPAAHTDATALHLVTPETEPTFADDVRRLVDIQTLLKELDAEADRIKARIRAHGSGQVGDLKVSVTPQRRFSTVLAAEKLTAEQLVAITETTTCLSGTKAKQVLPPMVYESLLYEIGEPRVSIR